MYIYIYIRRGTPNPAGHRLSGHRYAEQYAGAHCSWEVNSDGFGFASSIRLAGENRAQEQLRMRNRTDQGDGPRTGWCANSLIWFLIL